MTDHELAQDALAQMALPLVRLAHPEALVAEHLGKVAPSDLMAERLGRADELDAGALLAERYPDAGALEAERPCE